MTIEIEHTHDPGRDRQRSLKSALSKIRDEMGDVCPDCDGEIRVLKGSIGGVFVDGEVFVYHKSGGYCLTDVDVDWHAEEGHHAE